MPKLVAPLRQLLLLACALPLLGACAAAIEDVRKAEIRYTPLQTSVDELVAQAGLPNKRAVVRIDGEDYELLTYSQGPQSVSIVRVTALVTPGMVQIIDVGQIHRDLDAKVAMQCLVNKARKVVDCQDGRKS